MVLLRICSLSISSESRALPTKIKPVSEIYRLQTLGLFPRYLLFERFPTKALCLHCGWLLLKCSAIGIGFNGAETNCRIAHILGILLMNSCNTDIFFSNYYHLQSVRFELYIFEKSSRRGKPEVAMDFVLLLINNNNSQVSKKTDLEFLESVNTKLKALSAERGKMIDDVSVCGPAVG